MNHAVNRCRVDGTAIVQRTPSGLSWLQTDAEIHVAKHVYDDPEGREWVETIYTFGEWCEDANAYHARLIEETA